MRNPFSNTEDYMIVRQFDRMKNRSNSSNFSSDIHSNLQSSRVKPNVRENHNRFNREYAGISTKYNVYQVETKRARLFGVQELRYRPAYFDSLSKEKDNPPIKSKEPTEKSIRSPALKSSHQIKTVSSKKSERKITLEPKCFYKPADIIDVVEEDENWRQKTQDKKRISMKFNNEERFEDNITKKRRRSSQLSQMVELNVTNNRSNQYASIMDLKSKNNLSTDYLSSTRPTLRKKNSIFYDQQRNLELQVQSDCVSSKSQIEQQSFVTSRTGSIKHVASSIRVRNKIYYIANT